MTVTVKFNTNTPAFDNKLSKELTTVFAQVKDSIHLINAFRYASEQPITDSNGEIIGTLIVEK